MIPLRNLRRFFLKSIKAPGYAAETFIRRMRAQHYYYFGKGKAGVPESITFFLTHRCNLRCKMCGQWGDGGAARAKDAARMREELSLARFIKIVDEIAYFSPHITLFGGEPLLHQDAGALIAHVKKKGLHCLMITNGSLLETQAALLVDSGLDELNVSVDGDAALHDLIRGLPGLFDTLTRGLQQIKRLKDEKGRRLPRINLQCTISQYNYLHLEKLIEVARDVRADSLTFHNLIFLDQETLQKQKECDALLSASSDDWQGFAAESGIDPEILYRKISAIMNRRYPFAVDFYPNLSHKELAAYYKGHDYKPKEYACRCLSPWISGYIFPDGEIRPCLNLSYSFGNIKDRPFKDIWNSAQAIRFRLLVKEKKIFPACIRCTELYRY